MTESYVTARELAGLMGVSRATVLRWTSAGMPSETWGLGHTRRYLPSVCVEWARNRSSIDDDNPPERRSNVVRA